MGEYRKEIISMLLVLPSNKEQELQAPALSNLQQTHFAASSKPQSQQDMKL